jgi:uncharacterized membrane protein YoaK (UPF0700 family)
MTALHRTDEILSRRHIPSWLMLTFAAGCVNATAFLACERFVTHVTGTVTHIGMEVARLAILLDFVIVLTCFVLGAVLSSVLINGRAHKGLRPLYHLPLVIVAAATASVGVLGHLGLLGPFGGALDQPGDFILQSVLSFASGLQNAAVATTTGLLVRTTHLTGPATDLGIHIVDLFYLRDEPRRNARRHALLRAGKIMAFVLGAAAGVTLGHKVQFLAFMLPAGIIVAATVRSFLPRTEAADRTHDQPPQPAEPLSREPICQ